MANHGIDHQSAAAEAQLDRIDDGPGRLGATDAVVLGDGMHVETEPPDLPDGEDDDEEHLVVDQSDLVDALGEAFNARDLEALTELCADDCETPGLASDMDELPTAMADLWERRPTITLSRTEDEGRALGVLWERGETAGWAAVGTMHVDVDDDGLADVLEFSDDVGLLDELVLEPPDSDLDQGLRWEEWDEGAEG